MPIIPLPKISLLEDVPAPVLDRVRRPTFDNSAVIEGLGHQYPNGINHPVVMANALWEIFRTQALP